MITFGKKLKHLRQKNHLTQKELGMAVGFPDNCADVRIAQYESDVRTPKEDLMKLFASTLGVPVEYGECNQKHDQTNDIFYCYLLFFLLTLHFILPVVILGIAATFRGR